MLANIYKQQLAWREAITTTYENRFLTDMHNLNPLHLSNVNQLPI